MGFDFFAIATIGFYPTPIGPPTMRARMAFAATWGYVNIGTWGSLGCYPKGLGRL